MARHEKGSSVPLTVFTTDTAGVLTTADTLPDIVITGPGTDTTPTLTLESTGTYTTTFDADAAGVWVGVLTATVGGVVYVTTHRWTVHDGAAEANRTAFPQGLSSWVPAV